MHEFSIKKILTENIEDELLKIGFDSGYYNIASSKFKFENFKIYNLSPEQANILKQTALSVGSDCATHREVIRGKIENSDIILGGSYSQLKKISEKLKKQPFGLKILAENLLHNIDKQIRKTKLVGILNLTPDSFSDGGKYMVPEKAEKYLMQMIEEGADIIDIGAESTKPYSENVEPNEQIRRLKPILDFIQKEKLNVPISVDTRSSVVAAYALENGVSIINDVSGFDYDEKMPEIIAKTNAKVIIQHSKGTPQNMQDSPMYENLIDEIYFSLKSKAEYAKNLGIKDIIIDPGIGFGKTKENNLEILNRIEEFHSLNLPIMIGLSRKSFLGITNDDNDIKDFLSAAVSYSLINKIDYLRVHNVKLHKLLLNIDS